MRHDIVDWPGFTLVVVLLVWGLVLLAAAQ